MGFGRHIKSKSGLAFSSFVLFIAWIGSICVLIYISILQVHLAFDGVKINATVIHVERSGRVRVTTFRFTDKAGKIIDSKGGHLLHGAGLKEVGDIVPIVYLPSNTDVFVAQGNKYFSLSIGLIVVVLGSLGFFCTFSEYRLTRSTRAYFAPPGKKTS